MAVTELSPQDAHLLTLIREGKVDAEIAVRLGVATADVKARVENLIQLLGVRARAELTELKDAVAELKEDDDATAELGISRVAPAWQSRVAGVLAGILLGVIAAWTVMQAGTRDVSQPVDNEASQTTAAPASVGPPAPVASVARPSGLMRDAGTIFAANGMPVRPSAVVARGEVIEVELPGGSLFLFENGEVDVSWVPQGRRLYPATETYSSNLGFALHIQAADDDTQFVTGAAGSTAIYSNGARGPRLLLWVDGHHAEMTESGRLYISEQEVALEDAIAYDTGETLDVSHATPIGFAGEGWNGTFCGDETSLEACYVVTRPGPESYPIGGRMVCSRGVLEFSNQAFRLLFHRLSPSGPEAPGCDPFSETPVEVAAGEPFAPNQHYRVEAFDLDGNSLSVVAGRDGRLYVGAVPIQFGCPCRQGS